MSQTSTDRKRDKVKTVYPSQTKFVGVYKGELRELIDILIKIIMYENRKKFVQE